MHVHQLQHLALGDDVGGVGQDFHDPRFATFHHHLESAGVQEVAHQHAGRVAERDVGGGATTPKRRIVDHVVVQQGGGVDELDHRGKLVTVGVGAAQGPSHQQ